jgi:hypothetical protein
LLALGFLLPFSARVPPTAPNGLLPLLLLSQLRLFGLVPVEQPLPEAGMRVNHPANWSIAQLVEEPEQTSTSVHFGQAQQQRLLHIGPTCASHLMIYKKIDFFKQIENGDNINTFPNIPFINIL